MSESAEPNTSQQPKNDPRSQPTQPGPPPPRSSSFTFVLFLIIGVVVLMMLYRTPNGNSRIITWGRFLEKLENGEIVSANIQGQSITGLRVIQVVQSEEKTKDNKGNKDKAEPEPIVPFPNEVVELIRKNIDKREKANISYKITPHDQGKTIELEFQAVDFSTEIPSLAFSDSNNLNGLLYDKLGSYFSATQPTDWGNWILLFSFGFTFLIVMMLIMRARQMRDPGIGIGFPGFNRSPARKYAASDKSITFEDVAGLDGVKKELVEIVDFLKDPERFQRMGARVPKGTLLMGPPGTGKTLLGRAVAGEAGVPFYSINGSEFIQMFAGVGASRVRDLFNTAKENAPAILFIDEIDAVGRHRGTGIGAGHDEREQTLNQILSEMDGFTQTESVMVMAATNRPDVLDPALLRPGRFDRHITVDRPSLKGRLAIFKVHSKNIPLAENVDLRRLAKSTVGFTGADIRNLVNEATLWATRNGKDNVEMSDFDFAQDKVLMGIRREEVVSDLEKRKTAYHEAGHTVLDWFKPTNTRVRKVSIIPRGRTGGATLMMPEDDQLIIAEPQIRAQIAVYMGGRAAESLLFNEFSAGAENDLKQATRLARKMVVHWGMSPRLGPIAFRTDETHPFLGRDMSESREYSDHTAQIIDEEISRILQEAEVDAKNVLTEKRELLEILAKALESEEELEEVRIIELIGVSPFVQEKKRDEEEW